MLTGTVAGYVGTVHTRTSREGNAIFSFSVAHKQWNYRTQEKDTLWVSASIAGKKATGLGPHIRKGTFVVASGEMKLETFETRDGVTKSEWNIWCSDIQIVNPKLKQDGPPQHAEGTRRMDSFDEPAEGW